MEFEFAFHLTFGSLNEYLSPAHWDSGMHWQQLDIMVN